MRKIWVLFILLLLSTSAFAQNQDNKAPLQGPWQNVDDPGKLLIFKGDDLFVSYNNAQFRWTYSCNDTVITLSDLWDWSKEYPYEIVDGDLEVSFSFASGRFRRLETTPPELLTDPLEFGTEQPSVEEIERLKAELIARGEKDQAIREQLNGVFTAEKKDPEAEKKIFAEMAVIDQDNRKWLIEIVSQYGWIDSERFGKEAANAAFLIVQHSQYLPLMRAALPMLKKEAEAGAIRGGSFALLYDRTMLSLGIRQRYGTQVKILNGEPHLSPIEDIEKADAHRAELGMGKLQDYLNGIEEQFGKPVVIRK